MVKVSKALIPLTFEIACSFVAATHRHALVMCKTKTSGWSPKAFHQLKDGFCDFNEPIQVPNLNQQNYQQIHEIISELCFTICINCCYSMSLFKVIHVRSVNIMQ